MIVVFNDNALDLIRAKQHMVGFDTVGTEFQAPHWGLIAAAFSLGYAQVNDEMGCRQAVKIAESTATPTIIDALIDPTSYPTSATD